MLVDIEAAIRSGKGPGYERWAKVFNLKQLSQAVLYLKEHGDMGYEDLLEKANAATTNFNTLSVQIKDLESRMNANAELQKQIVNYAKTRAVYVEYRKAGYSKKYRIVHEAEILLHQAAKNHFDELGIQKLPSVKSLREEYTDLLEQKRKAYSAYKQAKNDMKELHNVRANVEYLLEISSPRYRSAAQKNHVNKVCQLFVFSVPTERAAIATGNDLRGLGICHNKHLAGIPGTGFLLNTQSYVRLHCLPVVLRVFGRGSVYSCRIDKPLITAYNRVVILNCYNREMQKIKIFCPL